MEGKALEICSGGRLFPPLPFLFFPFPFFLPFLRKFCSSADKYIRQTCERELEALFEEEPVFFLSLSFSPSFSFSCVPSDVGAYPGKPNAIERAI